MLTQSFANEEGIEIFEIRQAYQLGAGGLVADVAFVFRVRGAQLGGGLSEESHVEHVSFVGINEVGMGFAQLGRNEVSLDGVGVDAVVDPGEVAADVPTERLALLLLEALEFLDEVEFELDRDPRGELEGDVEVRIGASVASGFGLDADGAGALDPLLGGENKTIEARLLSNPIEFDGIKTGVVDLLPDAEELDGVAVAQPVKDEVVSALRILVSGDICEADVVVPFDAGDADFAGENFDLLAHGLGGV